jgi:hypothetical protein
MTIEQRLATGVLRVDVARADWPLDSVCAFAARDNPKRGFLVVSRLLGRHIGAKPSAMRASVRDLVARMPRDLPGPVLVMGLAETAICLGQMVHEELRAQQHRADALFLHSTRQEIAAPLLCGFEEPHSHAPAHLLYRPDADMTAFRSLVMVDDEISTGTTLVNLCAAVTAQLPALERVAVATLANWSDDAWLDRLPGTATVTSLIAGRLDWQQGNSAATPAPTPGTISRSTGTLDATHNFGRTGRFDVASESDALADALDLPRASRVRVIATGEFTYPPFRLAEALEAMGHDVVMHSTTRSPARIGGAIESMLRFADNYGSGVPNFLYNVDPADGRETFICHETPPGSIDPALVAALDARTLHFERR